MGDAEATAGRGRGRPKTGNAMTAAARKRSSRRAANLLERATVESIRDTTARMLKGLLEYEAEQRRDDPDWRPMGLMHLVRGIALSYPEEERHRVYAYYGVSHEK